MKTIIEMKYSQRRDEMSVKANGTLKPESEDACIKISI